MSNTTCIYVATHKQFHMHLPSIYRFCQVNAAKNGRWEGYLHDDDPADNISGKNDCYSELTALYALWKDTDPEIKGLTHYRRFFARTDQGSLEDYALYSYDTKRMGKHVITEEQIREALKEADIILTYPDNPFFVDAYEDLHRWVFDGDIRVLDRVMAEDFPDYLEAYEQVLNRTNISYLNMMIARKEVFDGYCDWLFAVLGAVEEGTDLTGYDPQHRRIYGYLSEVLLNVWALKQGLKVRYVGEYDLLESRGTAQRIKYGIRSLVPRKILAGRILAATDLNSRFERLQRLTESGMFRKTSEAGGRNEQTEAPLTLTELYASFRTSEDLLAYYGQFREVETFREVFSLKNGPEIPSVTTRYEGHDLYSYPQSNRFVIVNLFLPEEGFAPEDLSDLLSAVREKYGARYTVNIRLMTADRRIPDKAAELGRYFAYPLSRV